MDHPRPPIGRPSSWRGSSDRLSFEGDAPISGEAAIEGKLPSGRLRTAFHMDLRSRRIAWIATASFILMLVLLASNQILKHLS